MTIKGIQGAKVIYNVTKGHVHPDVRQIKKVHKHLDVT